MVWTAPKTEIRSFERRVFQQSKSRPGTETFTAKGMDFAPGTDQSGFLFLRAADAARGIHPADIIPCESVEVVPASPTSEELEQTITFKASLHEREAGTYHLIGWRATDDEGDGLMVNNACVFEFALTILAAPREEVMRAMEESHESSEGSR